MRAWLRPSRLLALAVVVLLAGALTAGLLLARPTEQEVTAGSPAPPSSRPKAPELEGEVLVPPRVTLAALRGKPVVVNFWASWCIPCRKEAPELRRFDETMRDRAQLVGVAFQDARKDSLAFTREFRWRFPNIRDPKGKLAARYGLIGLPTTYVIDAQGRIARQLTGEQNFGSLRRAVEELE